MMRKPSFLNRRTAALQRKLNDYVPERVHRVLTAAIRDMVKGVLLGARSTASKPTTGLGLQEIEYLVADKIRFYKNTAAVEGGITGFGGVLSGLADFPLFLAIKMKMLFEIAALYGFDVTDLRERLYILNIFQLCFSSAPHRRSVFLRMRQWQNRSEAAEQEEPDWRRFQQEYRDYIDLAKLAQLLPGIGAVIGAVVNERLTKRLGAFAMNAYRMRLMDEGD